MTVDPGTVTTNVSVAVLLWPARLAVTVVEHWLIGPTGEALQDDSIVDTEVMTDVTVLGCVVT